MEAEVRAILAERFTAGTSVGGLGSRIHALFAAIDDEELDLPERTESPRAAEFGS
jgi:hypothetical protein